MGCTIDHLRADHRIDIIQEFEDARGVRHHVGETGIIRHMDLDWPRQEIQIEWERDGRTETMIFGLRARSGPRNGAMREFFAIGDYLPKPRLPAANLPQTQPHSTPPDGEDTAVYAPPPFPRKQPSAQMSLGEKAVACECDRALHRAVLVEPRNIHVTACLRCGTVTCTEMMGDDGRYHGNPSYAYFTVKVAQDVVDWLALWPRVKVTYADSRWPMRSHMVRREHLYFPADFRCQTKAQLAQHEQQLEIEQRAKSKAQRLRDLDWPNTPPPPGMPELLSDFVDVWNALRAKPNDDLSKLVFLAQASSRASDIAVDLLWRRSDAFKVMVKALRSSDEVWQSVGFAMARDPHPGSENISEVVIEILQSLSFAPLLDVPNRIVSCGRFEELLILIAERKLRSPEVRKTLTDLQRRLVGHDDWLVKYIGIVLREMI